MHIQTELLNLLRDLPVCVGLGVKGDVHKIEQFYSRVFKINLEMAGFIDLSTLALVASYQMNVRGMTTVSQVMGDPEKELEKEDPAEPEPVQMELEKEKAPVASRSRCTRSTAPRRPRRKPNKRLITRDIIDLDLYP